MIRMYVILVCLLTLLVVPAVASPQANTTTNTPDAKAEPQRNAGPEATPTAAPVGHLVRPNSRPNLRDLFGRTSNPGYSTIRPTYEVAQSSGPSSSGEERKSDSGSDPKPDSEPKADPDSKPALSAIEEEIETLKARIADLEKQVASGGGSAGSAPQREAEKSPGVPEALQLPEPSSGVDNFTPFAYGDFTWLNGTSRNKAPIFDTKFFTPEVRFDTHYMHSFNNPVDHSLGGATESFRSDEVQIEQISVGGDFHWQNVRGRVLYMNGLFTTTTPRNDASSGVGQWDVRGAYRNTSEAYGGYHFNVNHGLNVDAGIFVSYIGLFSYYNFDNWAYQPSFVSSNTPWFFNGVRVQWFPTNKLKIEPWFINGWQTYNKFNSRPGIGGQILWRPKEWVSLVFNNYGNGTDTLGNGARKRLHTDDSVEVRYFNRPDSMGISKMAFSLTGDLGCEYSGGVTCTHNGPGGPKQAFAGWMLYNRMWFRKDLMAVTVGGGKMNNPGRYLTLLPPINGADALSGSPYFTASAGDQAHMWDGSVNFQYMPRQYVTFWTEAVYRHSDVPYWTGRGGITPPGGNNGFPAQFACGTGAASGTNDLATATANCGAAGVWFPDLRKNQTTISAGVLVRF